VTTLARLDMPDYVGQRSLTYRYDLVDVVTGYRQSIQPLRSPAPRLTHNTQNIIKRNITGLYLGVEATEFFNSISSRLELFMLIDGTEYPLGLYVPADWAQIISTNGTTSSASFYDEGYIIDQQLSSAFGAVSPGGELVMSSLARLLGRYPITSHLEATNYSTSGSWSAGTRGGFVVEQLAFEGDYFSPWFDHSSVMQFIRSFDPAAQIPTFNFDVGNRVLRENILKTDNLINAPNRFVIIGNGSSAMTDDVPIVGVADVPSTAPHSILNRGFVIPHVEHRQIDSVPQASAIALNLARQRTLFEQVELDTLPDPRHDSYDVIRWQDANWLEISWSLSLTPGSPMRHTLRRAYLP
jgi:hypothetical protein